MSWDHEGRYEPGEATDGAYRKLIDHTILDETPDGEAAYVTIEWPLSSGFIDRVQELVEELIGPILAEGLVSDEAYRAVETLAVAIQIADEVGEQAGRQFDD